MLKRLEISWILKKWVYFYCSLTKRFSSDKSPFFWGHPVHFVDLHYICPQGNWECNWLNSRRILILTFKICKHSLIVYEDANFMMMSQFLFSFEMAVIKSQSQIVVVVTTNSFLSPVNFFWIVNFSFHLKWQSKSLNIKL